MMMGITGADNAIPPPVNDVMGDQQATQNLSLDTRTDSSQSTLDEYPLFATRCRVLL